MTPDVPIPRLPQFRLLDEIPRETAAAALSLPPATTGNWVGSLTRAAISDFSLPAITLDLTTGGNKVGLILRALRISVSYCREAIFKHPTPQATDGSVTDSPVSKYPI